MRTELASRRIVVSWLLTSLCLRYGVAKPSVWLCRKACKLCQFNGFGSDYPLNLPCFWLQYWSVLENWYVRTFLALRSEGCRSVGKVSQSWSQSPGNVAGSCNDLAGVLLIRKHCRSSSSRGRELGTPFSSEDAGRFLSPQRPLHVAARACWLNLHRKSWLDLKTGERLQSKRTECWCHRSQVHKDRKEPIMHKSRGAVSFTPLFTTDDIGLRKDASVEHVVKVFLNVGEAMAARWIELPRGILLLQAVPDQPASGAIYLYDRERHIFFFVNFVDGRDDTLTAAEFDQLVAEYDLVSWTANPAFLPARIGNTAMA